MSPLVSAKAAGFVPLQWDVPHPGTNGYISTWGAILAGVSPRPFAR
ncbi:hypothetical protein [Humidisolicoccus flavus]